MGLPEHVETVVIGAGFGGMAMFHELRRAGRDVLVLERGSTVGGVWRDNAYPGCACDVDSHLYSFADAPNPDWTRTYSHQPEIQAYLERVAQQWGMADRTRFGCTVTQGRWDPAARRWRLETTDGTVTAQFVVSAAGGLSEPRLPDLSGAAQFEGRIVHTARWPADLDLTGQAVVVIGTGASAIQVVPAIAPDVAHLTVVQRTPAWVLPRPEAPIPERVRARYRRSPSALRRHRQALYRRRERIGALLLANGAGLTVAEQIARRFLAREVADPATRAALSPDYRLGCKRILISNDYYAAFNRPNVALVAQAATGFEADAVVTADGARIPADVVVLATGFEASHPPIADRLHGTHGRTLAEAFGAEPHAYLGTVVHGFPNLFLLAGPNTGTGHTSVVVFEEAQARYVRQAVAWAADRDRVLDVDAGVQRRYNDVLQRKLAASVWAPGVCRSWYQGPDGAVFAIWPAGTKRFEALLERFDPAVYADYPSAGT